MVAGLLDAKSQQGAREGAKEGAREGAKVCSKGSTKDPDELCSEGKFKEAEAVYTELLEKAPEGEEVVALLYNNRGHARWELCAPCQS